MSSVKAKEKSICFSERVAGVGFAGAEAGEKQDDGVFDIITEEEVSGVYDSDSFTTACSSTHGQQGAAQL